MNSINCEHAIIPSGAVSLIAHIRGKDPSVIQTKGGMRIPRATLNSFVGHMEESRHIERFSFAKDSAGNLVLTVQPRLGSEQLDAEKIHRKLARALGSVAKISVRIADSQESNPVND